MTMHEGKSASADNVAPWPVAIITASDGVVAGTRDDRSGAALAQHLEDQGWKVLTRMQVADGVESVGEAILAAVDALQQASTAGLVVTTGGTGFGPRDLTPEGTRSVLEREAPGIAEAMRLVNPRGLGRLSRATAGTVQRCLVVNTPGSTSGAIETLDAVLDMIPHALDLMAGGRPH